MENMLYHFKNYIILELYIHINYTHTRMCIYNTYKTLIIIILNIYFKNTITLHSSPKVNSSKKKKA